jgi:hypothetical protein
MNFRELMWINVNSSCQSKQFYVNVSEFTWILTWFYFILIQIIWLIPNLHEYIRICYEFIWKYAHYLTAAHCRTAGQPHTAANFRSDGHSRALCCTLHELECRTNAAWIRMSHTAHRICCTPLTAAHRDSNKLKQFHVNVYGCTRIYLN